MKAEELAIFYEDFSEQQAGCRDGLLGASPALPSLHQWISTQCLACKRWSPPHIRGSL